MVGKIYELLDAIHSEHATSHTVIVKVTENMYSLSSPYLDLKPEVSE